MNTIKVMDNIKVSDVIIPQLFIDAKPKNWKLNRARRYYLDNGIFDKPIVLNGNTLVDGYVRYLVAVELGLEEIPYVTNNIPSIKYIIGKFDGNNKEYVWKNINNIPIEIGDMVLVKSKDRTGRKMVNNTVVTVTDTFESDDAELLKHRVVIKKIENI